MELYFWVSSTSIRTPISTAGTWYCLFKAVDNDKNEIFGGLFYMELNGGNVCFAASAAAAGRAAESDVTDYGAYNKA